MKILAGAPDTVGDMHRVVQSIPASYTIWKDGLIYRAESNVDGGTDYSGTDAITVIQCAIDAADASIFIRKGSSNYLLNRTGNTGTHLIIDGKTNFTIASDGATLEFCAEYYPAMHAYERNGLGIFDSTNITISGLVFDGNQINQTLVKIPFVEIVGCTTVHIDDCVFTDGYYHPLLIGQFTSGGNYDINVSNCTFTNNHGNMGTCVNFSEVYTNDGIGTGSFTNCYFERTHLTDSIANTIYAGGTFWTYHNCHFSNTPLPFDFRAGTHNIDGAYGNNIYTAIILQGGASVPVVTAKNVMMTNVYGTPGTYVEGVFVVKGILRISDSQFFGSGANFWYGICLRSADVTSCKISDCVFDGATVFGINIDDTAGKHVLDHNIISNCANGMYSVDNDHYTTVYDTIFTTIAGVNINNADGMLILAGTSDSGPTVQVGDETINDSTGAGAIVTYPALFPSHPTVVGTIEWLTSSADTKVILTIQDVGDNQFRAHLWDTATANWYPNNVTLHWIAVKKA